MGNSNKFVIFIDFSKLAGNIQCYDQISLTTYDYMIKNLFSGYGSLVFNLSDSGPEFLVLIKKTCDANNSRNAIDFNTRTTYTIVEEHNQTLLKVSCFLFTTIFRPVIKSQKKTIGVYNITLNGTIRLRQYQVHTRQEKTFCCQHFFHEIVPQKIR